MIADGQGTVWAAGLCDCTLQRRNRTIVEESASPGLPAPRVAELCDAAARLAAATGFSGVGTVEFLVGPDDAPALLLDVDTALQRRARASPRSSPASTWSSCSCDVARGRRLAGDRRRAVGARDRRAAERGGPRARVRPHPGPDRACCGSRPGPGCGSTPASPRATSCPPASTRSSPSSSPGAATARRRSPGCGRALRQTDGRHRRRRRRTRRSCSTLLDRPEFAAGRLDTGWLDRGDRRPQRSSATEHAEVALLQAAIDAYDDATHELARKAFFAPAARGRPEARRDAGRPPDRAPLPGPRGTAARAARSARTTTGSTPARARLDADASPARGPPGEPAHGRRPPGRTVSVASDGPTTSSRSTASPHRFTRDDGGVVRAPAPGRRGGAAASPRRPVAAGDTVAVLEAMKMETAVPRRSPAGSARSRRSPTPRSTPGSRCSARAGRGPDGRGPRQRAAAQQRRPRPAGLAEGDPEPTSARRWCSRRCARTCSATTRPRGRPARCVTGAARPAGRRCRPTTRSSCDRRGRRSCRLFADLCALSRRQHEDDDDDEQALARSPQEYLDRLPARARADRARLPAAFRDRLRRALARYGVTGLTVTGPRRGAVCASSGRQQRLGEAVPVVASLLERWLATATGCCVDVGDRTRPRAARPARAATQGRYPASPTSPARSRFRLVRRAGGRAGPGAGRTPTAEALPRGAASRPAADRSGRTASPALVACPQPLRRAAAAAVPRRRDRSSQGALLEVCRPALLPDPALDDVAVQAVTAGRSARRDYAHEGHQVHLVMRVRAAGGAGRARQRRCAGTSPTCPADGRRRPRRP